MSCWMFTHVCRHWYALQYARTRGLVHKLLLCILYTKRVLKVFWNVQIFMWQVRGRRDPQIPVWMRLCPLPGRWWHRRARTLTGRRRQRQRRRLRPTVWPLTLIDWHCGVNNAARISHTASRDHPLSPSTPLLLFTSPHRRPCRGTFRTSLSFSDESLYRVRRTAGHCAVLMTNDWLLITLICRMTNCEPLRWLVDLTYLLTYATL